MKVSNVDWVVRARKLAALAGPASAHVVDAATGDGAITDAERGKLVDLIVEVVDMVVAELTPTSGGRTAAAQDALGAKIFEMLMKSRLFPTPQIEALTNKLMELARANHAKLGKV